MQLFFHNLPSFYFDLESKISLLVGYIPINISRTEYMGIAKISRNDLLLSSCSCFKSKEICVGGILHHIGVITFDADEDIVDGGAGKGVGFCGT